MSTKTCQPRGGSEEDTGSGRGATGPRGLRRRRCQRAAFAAVLVLGLTATAGCVDTGPRTAYCEPDDPVVTPGSVAPGGELRIEVSRPDDAVNCEPRLPDRARYEVRIGSERRTEGSDGGRYTAELGELEPSSDGPTIGVVRVPDDVPAGAAEVTVRVEGVDTNCDLDPTIGCAPPPSAAIVVTG